MGESDWDDFTHLAIIRHRVAPALAETLDRCGIHLPEPVREAIQAEARACGFTALAQRTESLRLANLLEAAGITPVWLKGWPLAEQIFGGPGLRHASDIDILVTPAERVRALRCLTAAGYDTMPVHRLRGRLIAGPAVQAECKDIALQHLETGLAVELHWRTNHFRGWPNLVDLADLGEDFQSLPGIAGPGRILVPGPVGQLTYLACHGQQHLFGRLKWLLDIARLAKLRGVGRLADDLASAEAAGAGRPVRLALHMAWRVFGAPVPEWLRALEGRESAWGAQILAAIADDRNTPGGLRARLDFYRWHWRLAETVAQRIAVLRGLAWRPLRLGIARLGQPAAG